MLPATCRAIIVSSEQQLARSLAARARARRGSLSLGFSGAGAMLCCCGVVVASGAGEARDLFGQERWGRWRAWSRRWPRRRRRARRPACTGEGCPRRRAAVRPPLAQSLPTLSLSFSLSLLGAAGALAGRGRGLCRAGARRRPRAGARCGGGPERDHEGVAAAMSTDACGGRGGSAGGRGGARRQLDSACGARGAVRRGRGLRAMPCWPTLLCSRCPSSLSVQ